MKIYTGYFAKLNKYPFPISIAAKTPNWFFGEQLKELSPKWKWFSIWKKALDFRSTIKGLDYSTYSKKLEDLGIGEVVDILNNPVGWYVEQYLNQLKETFPTPKDLYEMLEKRFKKENITLCCYEKAPAKFENVQQLEPGKDFCHRHIIREYLGDFNVKEYQV